MKIISQDNNHSYTNLLKKIPDKPIIYLDNYLLDLIDCEDDKKKSIYLNDSEHIIEEIWDEIIQNNWRKMNVRCLIPEKFGVTPSIFYAYKNGKKNISITNMYRLLEIWQNFCNKDISEIKDKWDEIFNEKLLLSVGSACQKTSLPRFIDPKMAYLIGWICGDGNLQIGINHYIVKISEKSLDQLKFILKPLFDDVFKVDSPIFRRYGNGYSIQIGSKLILKFFTNVLDVEVGRIPKIVNDFDEVNKKYFLMGIFDSEGYVNSGYNYSVITISQSSRIFLEKIIRLFRQVGIIFSGPYIHKTDLGVWYTIRLRKKLGILKFIRKIGSCHIDKVKKLKELGCVIEKNWIY